MYDSLTQLSVYPLSGLVYSITCDLDFVVAYAEGRKE